jgi:dTDP-4-dehydrorhamnose 3,5-epimerase-like enzyme
MIERQVTDLVQITDLKINVDDRGILSELVRSDWEKVGVPIKQIYLVANTTRAVRAFHKHKELVDFFIIVNGTAKFVFFKKTVENTLIQVVNVTSMRLQMITVPTGVFHGWKADAGTILISAANNLYMGENRKDPVDEERIPWDTLGTDVWEVHNK